MNRISLNTKHWLYLACHVIVFLLGVLAVRSSDAIWIGVGSSLIAAGLAGWVIFLYVLISENVSNRLHVLSTFGVEAAFDGRSVRIKEEYVSRLTKANGNIDVMGFGLSALREDFISELRTWQQRAEVRILLIDPEFPDARSSYASQRDVEENNVAGKIAGDVAKFLKDAGPLIGTVDRHSLNIRLYRCLPAINIFRIDDELFWGPYLVSMQSRNMPTFLVKRGGLLFDKLTKHFEEIWTSDQLSRPAPQQRQ